MQVLHLGSQQHTFADKIDQTPDDGVERHRQTNTSGNLEGLRPGTGRTLRPLHGLTSLIDGVRRIVELRIELLRGLGNVDEGLPGLIERTIELLEALAGLLGTLGERREALLVLRKGLLEGGTELVELGRSGG